MPKVIEITVHVREYCDAANGKYHTLIIRPHFSDRTRCVFELQTNEYVFKIRDIEQALKAIRKAYV